MQDINNYIKKNDTDNVIVSRIDKIIYDIVDDDDEYEDSYGNSETMVEALKKLRTVISDNLLDDINDAKEMLTNIDLQLTVEKSHNSSSSVINVYGRRSKGSWDTSEHKYQFLSITKMNFNLVDISSTDIDEQGIFVGTLKMSETFGVPVRFSGVLCGVCNINNISQMCMVKVVEDYSGSGNNKVYLLLNDTSVLTTTGQTLHITTATGTLNHTYDY